MRKTAFTLVELLVTISVIAVLLSALLPALSRARGQARAAVCGSNIRQLALANVTYAGENGGRFCPGAAQMKTDNLQRWHGTRATTNEAFNPARGPLVPYLGPDARLRACPSFNELAPTPDAFERGNGGYGYNQAYLGRILQAKSTGSFRIVTDLAGVMAEHVRRPGETLMFADTAFADVADGVIEYSFAEPRYHPEHIYARLDPSLHFRHLERATVAWCDGHVDRRRRTFTWRSGVYEGDPAVVGIGWFGESDDNGLFDLQ